MRFGAFDHFWKITSILLIFVVDICDSVKCYACASAEYQRLASLNDKIRVSKYDRLCDDPNMVEALAPVEACHTTCVTIYEPQYFGGLQSPQRPFLYIRGCAEHLFSLMKNHPMEIQFLHRAPICLNLKLSQIYPSVQANENVKVCSCVDDGCNSTSDNSSSSSSFNLYLFFLLIVIRYFSLI